MIVWLSFGPSFPTPSQPGVISWTQKHPIDKTFSQFSKIRFLMNNFFFYKVIKQQRVNQSKSDLRPTVQTASDCLMLEGRLSSFQLNAIQIQCKPFGKEAKPRGFLVCRETVVHLQK